MVAAPGASAAAAGGVTSSHFLFSSSCLIRSRNISQQFLKEMEVLKRCNFTLGILVHCTYGGTQPRAVLNAKRLIYCTIASKVPK